MSQHPIENLIKTAMESIMDMMDVNTVVGDTVETPEGGVIIPISKVSAGFAAGGSDYDPSNNAEGGKDQDMDYPFGGGCGAGVSVQPVGFLVNSGKDVRLIPVKGSPILDYLISQSPKMLTELKNIFKNGKNDIKVITHD
ncbi:MAG: sporulation protein YtfJ [Clostridia bacterium]|nr:sporulation protein YtfJ [Clostridia bacterium]